MKLENFADATDFVALPHDLLWSDEFSWTPVTTRKEYSLTGALIIDTATMLTGRPITLASPDQEMAWVTREVLKKLYTWSTTAGFKMRLSLEYPTDERVFVVTFAPTAEGPVVTAAPVKGFPGYEDGDWYSVTLKLMEIE